MNPASREIEESPTIGEMVTVIDGIARFSWVGEAALDDAIERVDTVIRYCRENGHERLLTDISRLGGFEPPTIGERFFLVEKWVAAAGGAVTLALVVAPHIIDPQKIGVTMAYNRGFRTDVFTDADEALAWLAAQ